MHSVITAATLLCSLGICVRLLTYRAHADASHRPFVGWLAWLLIASTGGQALFIVLLGSRSAANPFLLGLLVVLLIAVFRARGNVARLLSEN